VPEDVVVAALAAVARFSGKVGLSNVAAVLGARKTKWSTAQPWVEQLPFHGALKGWSDERVRLLLAELAGGGFARQSSGEYPVVELTPAGRKAVMLGDPPVVKLPALPRADAPSELLDALKRWRRETAIAAGVPAYVVFHDATLTAIAAARPKSLNDLLLVSGVGESKLRKYGEEILDLLRRQGAAT
jgi:superfamily II DNA helicase RecQ